MQSTATAHNSTTAAGAGSVRVPELMVAVDKYTPMAGAGVSTIQLILPARFTGVNGREPTREADTAAAMDPVSS